MGPKTIEAIGAGRLNQAGAAVAAACSATLNAPKLHRNSHLIPEVYRRENSIKFCMENSDASRPK